MNEKNNQPASGGRASAVKPSKEELHRQIQESLSNSRKSASVSERKLGSGHKSVSQLSEKQSSKKRSLSIKNKSSAVSTSNPADDKMEKMRRIKESMNSMDGSVKQQKNRKAPSSTAAEAQRYVQRQVQSQKRRYGNGDTYDFEIPRDYRQNKRYHEAQAVAERKSKVGIIAIFAVLILIVASYFIGAIWCSNGFLPHTYMNDVNISGMTMDEAERAVIHKVELTGLTFIKNNGEEVHFKGEEYGAEISIENDKAFVEAASQSSFLWFKNFFGNAKYSTKLVNTYDEKKLANLIENHTWGSAPPTDAYLQKQEDGTYIIVPEDNGDMIDTDILVKYALEQVRSGSSVIDLRECDCYLFAKVTEASLQKACEEANALQGLTITYDFDDRKEELESSVIVEWVSSDENGDIIVDENAVRAWVQANLANKYDTYTPGYTRTFNSTMQGTIEVPLGDRGIYGWLTDVEATASKLIEYIRAGESVTVTPEYIKKGYCRETDDIGSTYIEVDITNQHVWYYKDGELQMDSDCVTGMATDPDRVTPTGVFQIWSMERDIELKGEDYITPVSFWMNISECGVGLHDLSRTEYGGEIYKYNGSHGCINLPYDFAESLFNAADVGTPVLIIP
ncbi:MAG: L,D-transpeptidase/peptidoglycan binding protein [Ruminococcus sp.]|nr:L,D-transpeptidase/peptidoglycan binding protein [Ruminococcus sp.]